MTAINRASVEQPIPSEPLSDVAVTNRPPHDPSAGPNDITATFMFADIAGFTALTEAHGDKQAAILVAEFCDAVKGQLSTLGATQINTIGDALMLRIEDPRQAVLLGLRVSPRPAESSCADESRTRLVSRALGALLLQ
jgi:class 3 adenylate cyclase